MDEIPAVFTPSNEPYLDRQSLLAFDQMISATLNLNRHVAPITHDKAMSDLQRALCQLIPASLSICLSIRELIRQGYLYGALVLLRPLAERTVTALYLKKTPAALAFWHSGWIHGKRPGFKRMVDDLWGDLHADAGSVIATQLNSLVHGDPQSSEWNRIGSSSDSAAFAVSKLLDRPDICDRAALDAVSYLAELNGLMVTEFLSADDSKNR